MFSRGHEVCRRLAAGVAVLILSAGCAGNSSPSLTPSTPGPTSAATAVTVPSTRPTATSPTGQMTVGRHIQTATALADGRVLVAGGYTLGDIALASAFLYDPQTSTFAATGPLAAARGYDTATRLADGRVLIAGGNPQQWQFNGPFLASAELFDAKTGTFSATGALATARNVHTATLLLDGRVLFVGGNDAEPHTLASAEIYDPIAGTFSPTGSLVAARGFHTATLLADGRVLITGGAADGWNGNFLSTAELYDPETGTFTATGQMADPRGNHTATLLADGRVLITGGTGDGTTSHASAELYDPNTGIFTITGSMTAARTFQDATLLTDGRVLVTGGDPAGWVYDGPFLASAEIYDPKTGTFTETGSMTARRTYHTATLLADGRVLVTAGYGDTGPLASAELFDPKTGTFTPIGSSG